MAAGLSRLEFLNGGEREQRGLMFFEVAARKMCCFSKVAHQVGACGNRIEMCNNCLWFNEFLSSIIGLEICIFSHFQIQMLSKKNIRASHKAR